MAKYRRSFEITANHPISTTYEVEQDHPFTDHIGRHSERVLDEISYEQEWEVSGEIDDARVTDAYDEILDDDGRYRLVATWEENLEADEWINEAGEVIKQEDTPRPANEQENGAESLPEA